jgi:ribosomal protein L30
VRAVLECAGITDVLAKSLGTANPINVVHATVAALKEPARPEDVARLRDIELEEMPAEEDAREHEGQGATAMAEPRDRDHAGPQPHRPKRRPARTVRALGLRRIRQTVTQPDRPEIRGMIAKVAHLVEVRYPARTRR